MKYEVTATQEYTGLQYFKTTFVAENNEAAEKRFQKEYGDDSRGDDLQLHRLDANEGRTLLSINNNMVPA